MTVWCIVPVHNRRALTVRLVEQLAHQTLPPRVLVVDCGSTDGTAAALEGAAPSTRVLRADADVFWGAAVTLGLRALEAELGREDFVLLLNDDVTIATDYVETLVRCSRAHGDAAVGSLVFEQGRDDRLIEIGTRIDWLRCWIVELAQDESTRASVLASPSGSTRVDALSGRGALFPVPALRRAGMACHPLLPHYWADLELSARVASRGCPLLVCHAARVWTDARPSGVARTAPVFRRLFSRRSRYNVVDAVVFFSVSGPWLLRPSGAARVVVPRVRHAVAAWWPRKRQDAA